MNEFSTQSLQVAINAFPAAQRIFDSETYLIGIDNTVPETDTERLNTLYDPILQNLNEIGITSLYHLRDEALFARNDVYYVALQFFQYLFPGPQTQQAFSDPTIRHLVLAQLDRLDQFELGGFFKSLYQFPLVKGSIDIPFEENILEEFFQSCTDYFDIGERTLDVYLKDLVQIIPEQNPVHVLSPAVMSLLKGMRQTMNHLIGMLQTDPQGTSAPLEARTNVYFQSIIEHLSVIEFKIDELNAIVRNRVLARRFSDYPGDVPISDDTWTFLYFWYIVTDSGPTLPSRLASSRDALMKDLEDKSLLSFGARKYLTSLANTLHSQFSENNS